MPNPGFLAPLQSGASAGHVALGFMVLMSAAMLVAYFIVTKDDGNLNDDQRTVRDQVRAALDEPAATVRFPAHDIRSGTLTRSDLAAGLHDAFSSNDVEAPETPRQAVDEVRAAVGSAWGDATEDIPKHVLALGEWAVLVIVWGSIAVATGTIITALSWSAGRMTLPEYLDYITHVAGNGVDLVISLAFHFPYLWFIWNLGFAHAVLLVDIIYHHPWLLASVMLTVAAGLFVLERRSGEGVPEPELVRKRFILGALGAMLAVWLTGTLVTLILSPILALVGVGWLGHLLGFLAALAVAGVFGWLAVQEAKWRVRSAARNVDAATNRVGVVLGVRAFAGFLRPVAVAAVALYVIAGIVTGSLWAILHAALTASIEVKMIAAGTTMLVGYLLGREVSDAAPEVRRAIVELQARERARASAALTSIPYAGVVFAFIASWAWQLPLLLCIIIAILAGIGFRISVRFYHKARRSHAEQDDTRPPAGSLLAACRVIDTIAGTRYCATIGGTLYAHEDPSQLIETCVGVLQTKAYGDDPDPTVEEWYARSLREFGQADYAETYSVDHNGYLAGKLPERTRKRIVTELRNSPDRRCNRDDLIDDACGDIPDEVARRRLAELLTTPALRQHGDGTIRMKTDIWGNMVDTTRNVDEKRVEQAV